MGKKSDKMYITHSEWSNEFEGGMSFGYILYINLFIIIKTVKILFKILIKCNSEKYY